MGAFVYDVDGSALSEWIRMTFLDHSCPQRRAAMTMGYSSKRAEEGESKKILVAR